MSRDTNPGLTNLLQAVEKGDLGAREQLWRLVYAELRAMARSQMAKEAPGRTLQTTALVNEAYLRLVGPGGPPFVNRRHFFGAAAEAMRRIRVDDARKRKSLKRGGGRRDDPLAKEPAAFDPDPVELIAVHEALDELEQVAPRQAEVVKLRYFAGLSLEETATALELSPRTVVNEWRYARAWLHRALGDGEEPPAVGD